MKLSPRCARLWQDGRRLSFVAVEPVAAGGYNIVLENGRLTQTGTHEELAHRPGMYHETAILQIMDLDPDPEGKAV